MEEGGKIRSTSELDDDENGAEVNDSYFALNRRDEDDDIEGEGEDEDEDGDGAYTFKFKGDMDPLAFTEDDACGVQPYEQFERMEHEYEALAEKKRKALADHHHPPLHSGSPIKKSRQGDGVGASFEEIMEAMNFGTRRKSRKPKKRGRRKGSKKKCSPEVTQKLGDATLHYAHGRYEEAICLLKEVVRLAPNSPDPYHTLGLVYNAIGDRKKALNFYMLAAHLTPKDPSLWKLLVTRSIEQGNTGQARYCLSKAITADPEDISLKFNRASLYVELGDYQKAAESYEQISRLCPENIEALKTAAMFYQKCGQREHSVSVLEYYLKQHPNEVDFSVVDLLAAICMEDNTHIKALQHIEHARQVYCAGKELPLLLRIKEGICYVHLGHMERAEAIFSVLQWESVYDNYNLVTAVADSLISLGHYGLALKYYMILEGNGEADNGFLHLKVARCYLFLNERLRAIEHFHKALHTLQDNVDARITLASLLLDEEKEDEAIFVLSPPCSESTLEPNSDKSEPWWLNGKIKLKLCQIYKVKGLQEAFIDVILPLVRESLFLQTVCQKVKVRKRLSRSVLFERVKVLDDRQVDNVFHGFRPVASTSDLSKAARAKRLLQKKATLKEARKAATLVAGINWKSDDSDDDSPQQTPKKIPLPNLLKDEEHYCLVIDLCKALASSQRYWEALEIINLTLKLAYNILSVEKKEELQSLGAQMAYNTTDPTHGWDCARYIVNQHPYSFASWNCYYKVVSRLENRCSKKHNKFLHGMRVRHRDCIPAIVIFGHQLTMISQHQAAAREYLEAYKLMQDSPLINLCVGTALINLALGLRLQNKHQCMLQGLAFLYNSLLLSENSQEAIYNIARAYHHVGLVTLAASYYKMVLLIHEKDYPIPKLPNENADLLDDQKPGYCDLRREAAYNLHLIYKKSGAFDLARQVLKDHCAL